MQAPTGITVKKKTRVVEVAWEDGTQYSLPFEYLRVYSPSAEVRGHGQGQEVLQFGKEQVNISDIEPVGSYAVCLHFDDGHATGIYSWEYLHNLGVSQEQKWAQYLERLAAAGRPRKPIEA